MKKYTQPIIFSIEDSFDLVLIPFLEEYKIINKLTDTNLGFITKDLEPYVKDNELVLKEAVGEISWTSRGIIKYLIGSTDITQIVIASKINIILREKIKVEDIE